MVTGFPLTWRSHPKTFSCASTLSWCVDSCSLPDILSGHPARGSRSAVSALSAGLAACIFKHLLIAYLLPFCVSYHWFVAPCRSPLSSSDRAQACKLPPAPAAKTQRLEAGPRLSQAVPTFSLRIPQSTHLFTTYHSHSTHLSSLSSFTTSLLRRQLVTSMSC